MVYDKAMKRTWFIALGTVTLLSLACAAPPGQPADPREPTDKVLIVRVTTIPSTELIEPIVTGKYGPQLLENLTTDDGHPLNQYAVPPPVVTPWGWDFRLNVDTPGPLKATVRVKARRTVKVICDWYVGASSSVVVHQDTGYGETVCTYLMEK